MTQLDQGKEKIGNSTEDDAQVFSNKYPLALSILCFGMGEDFLAPLRSSGLGGATPLREAGLSFLINLRRVEGVAAIPYRMANVAVSDKRFALILAAERIRRMPIGPDKTFTPEMEGEARETARARIKKEMDDDLSSGRFPRMAEETLIILERQLANGEFLLAARELAFQTIASLWAAFEYLANDVINAVVNEYPELANKLINEAPAKRHFQTKTFSIDVLMEKNFNIAKSMGDILLGERSLASLDAIRDVFSTIAPNEGGLHVALASPTLWRLWQMRHVVVHRRGIVDRNYMDRTGDATQTLGAGLTVNRHDIDRAFEIVRDAGAAILRWRPLNENAPSNLPADPPK